MNPELLERACAGDLEARNAVAEELLPQIEIEAKKVAMKRGLDSRELISAGFVGLTQAIERFDTEAGARFLTYAQHRIRGAMLDQLRAEGRVPDYAIRRTREADHHCAALTQELGREPTVSEVEEALGPELTRKAAAARAFTAAPAEQPADRPVELDPAEGLMLRESANDLLWRMEARERLIAKLYHFHGVPMAEIGMAVGLSESRVSQILQDAHQRARRGARRGMKPDPGPAGRRKRPPLNNNLEVRKAAAARGRWSGGQTPFGYRSIARRLFVLEGEAVWVRRLFDRYLSEDIGQRALARWLNEKGVRGKNGGIWRSGDISVLLRNETYDGWVNFSGVRARGIHKPLLAPGVFRKVAEKVKRRTCRPRGTRRAS